MCLGEGDFYISVSGVEWHPDGRGTGPGTEELLVRNILGVSKGNHVWRVPSYFPF